MLTHSLNFLLFWKNLKNLTDSGKTIIQTFSSLAPFKLFSTRLTKEIKIVVGVVVVCCIFWPANGCCCWKLRHSCAFSSFSPFVQVFVLIQMEKGGKRFKKHTPNAGSQFWVYQSTFSLWISMNNWNYNSEHAKCNLSLPPLFTCARWVLHDQTKQSFNSSVFNCFSPFLQQNDSKTWKTFQKGENGKKVAKMHFSTIFRAA